MYLEAVDAELTYLNNNECDILYRAFVGTVSRRIRAHQPASCLATIVRADGSPADLLSNGFLLGGTDIAILQSAKEEGTAVLVQRRVRAFRRKAILSASTATGVTPNRPTVAAKLKCLYWMTKASVLMHVYESEVPVSPREVEVRTPTFATDLPTCAFLPNWPMPRMRTYSDRTHHHVASTVFSIQ